AVVGASRKQAPVRDEARLAGGQLRALGLNLDIAPDADLANAAGPAQDRGYSDDPVVAARLVRAAVDGYRRQGVAAAVGHFPGVVMSADLGAAAENLGESVSDAALDALRAGVDLLYVPGGLRDQQAAYDAVLAAARRGRISRRRIADSITRIQSVKRAFPLT